MRKTKLTIILAAATLLIVDACKNREQQVNNKATTIMSEEKIPDGFTIGVVTLKYAETGCKVIIDASIDGNNAQLLPIRMDEKFMKEGQKVQFIYRKSRAPQPEGCNIGMLVTVEKMTAR